MHNTGSARPGPARARLGAAALAAVCFAAACGERSASQPAAAPSPDVWAVVDGREIKKEDVERAYRRAAPGGSAPSQDEALTAKLQLLNEMIDQEILLARAAAMKVEVPDADLEKAFAERKSNMAEETFRKELDQRGLTSDDMKRDLRRELIVQKLIEQEVTSKITITDEAVRDFYDKNRAQFNVPETRHRIAQIVVTPAPTPNVRNRANDDAGTPAEAQRKVQMLVEKLKTGTDFAALARDYSEDPQSAPQGGDLGFIPASALNQVAPELRQAVLKAQPGDVATLSSRGGYVIMLLVAREEAGQRDLTTPGVKDAVSNLLKERREQLLTGAYLASARSEARVTNHLAKQIVQGGGAPPSLGPSAPR
jgi:peptidyl-prolyl cis-trans isomerase SurA